MQSPDHLFHIVQTRVQAWSVTRGLVRTSGNHFPVQWNTVSGSRELKITETSLRPSVAFIKLQGARNIFSISRQLHE